MHPVNCSSLGQHELEHGLRRDQYFDIPVEFHNVDVGLWGTGSPTPATESDGNVKRQLPAVE